MYVALPNNCINVLYNTCKIWKCLLGIVSDQNHQISTRIIWRKIGSYSENRKTWNISNWSDETSFSNKFHMYTLVIQLRSFFVNPLRSSEAWHAFRQCTFLKAVILGKQEMNLIYSVQDKQADKFLFESNYLPSQWLQKRLTWGGKFLNNSQFEEAVDQLFITVNTTTSMNERFNFIISDDSRIAVISNYVNLIIKRGSKVVIRLAQWKIIGSQTTLALQ